MASTTAREETAESVVGQQAAYLRGQPTQISEHVKSAKEAEAELAEVLKTLRSLRRVMEPGFWVLFFLAKYYELSLICRLVNLKTQRKRNLKLSWLVSWRPIDIGWRESCSF
ncbi:hypothetical protein Lser_V15G27638 [Lactuca serriola]